MLKDAVETKSVIRRLETRSPKTKSVQVDPIDPQQANNLPKLPEDLADRQKSLISLRQLSPSPPSHPLYTPHPPSSHTREQSTAKPRRALSHRRKSSMHQHNATAEHIPTKSNQPLESLRDPLEIIERLQCEPELGFLYMMPVHGRHSSKYNPYFVRCVVLVTWMCIHTHGKYLVASVGFDDYDYILNMTVVRIPWKKGN